MAEPCPNAHEGSLGGQSVAVAAGSGTPRPVTTVRAAGPVAQSPTLKCISGLLTRGLAENCAEKTDRPRHEVHERNPKVVVSLINKVIMRRTIHGRRSSPRHRAGVPGPSVLASEFPGLISPHFPAPRGQASPPGPRAENRACGTGARQNVANECHSVRRPNHVPRAREPAAPARSPKVQVASETAVEACVEAIDRINGTQGVFQRLVRRSPDWRIDAPTPWHCGRRGGKFEGLAAR